MNFRAWVMQQPDGRILIDTREFQREEDVWQIVLGWPDKSEVEDAKRLGYRVFWAQVSVYPSVGPPESMRQKMERKRAAK